jgi:hypothetical protein
MYSIVNFYLVHSGLDPFGGDFVGFNDVNNGTPTRRGISVNCIGQGLSDALE